MPDEQLKTDAAKAAADAATVKAAADVVEVSAAVVAQKVTAAVTEAGLPVRPTTTAEQDLRTASQRRINMIWEYTQAAIAIGTVAATFAAAFVTMLSDTPKEGSVLLQSAFFLVIGFYFGRTNHARIGDLSVGGRVAGRNNSLDDRDIQ